MVQGTKVSQLIVILSPFESIKAKHRAFIYLTKLFIVAKSILLHSSRRNPSSSSEFNGFRFSTRPLRIDQRFTVGLTSGLLDDQSIVSGTSLRRNCLVTRFLCLESLSGWNRWHQPNHLLALGIRRYWRIWT
jgi:hypothetical protein